MYATKPSVDLFLRDIGPEDITPHFQPIVDVFTASVIGYEVLSRGPAPFESPSLLFARARQLDLTAGLEHACHTAALERIADLQRSIRVPGWFVNVSPEVFSGETSELADQVRSFGIDPGDLVFEITEHEAIHDPKAFQRGVRAFAREGFHIAIDDFGAGTSGLVTLASSMPDVIKMDMALARNVHAHPYKQSIVRAMVSLAASVDARLVTEGVESWQELETLVRQGVRFAQGYLFGEPDPKPSPPADDLVDRLRCMRHGEENAQPSTAALSAQHTSSSVTLLPDQREIQSWIDEAMRDGGTLLCADLDRLGELNEALGFVAGDTAILLTAQVLARHLDALCTGARLGHIGGDDFVIVAPGNVSLDAVERLCADFDGARKALFDSASLTTLSIAVLPLRQLGRPVHPALLSQVRASLMTKAKEISKWRRESSFMVELRSHDGTQTVRKR